MKVNRRPPWLDHLGMIAAAALVAYAVAAAGAVLSALRSGHALDVSLLAQWPVESLACWYVPVLLAIFALEIAVGGWHDSPAWRVLHGTSPSHRTDVFYLATELLALGPMMAAVATIGLSTALDAVLTAPRAWQPAADLPLWLAVPLFIIVEPFFTYWSHRLMHTPLMWPLHAVHHAADDLTAISTTRHHPGDTLVCTGISGVPAALFGFPPDAVFYALVAMATATTLLHTRVPVPAWIEKYIVAGPRAHGIHHSRDAADHDTNFCLLPIYDRVFGTWRWHERPVAFGAGDARFDTGRPLHDIVGVYVIWIDGLCRAARHLARKQPISSNRRTCAGSLSRRA
ncbi:sterol desaturase family protein [Reyranella aquatilis]|uniref:Sterol desaturase family protein n=1 Tax=Reyranella aquatilis TaxID=2035356 RepID=A0ABS8KX55_9HYPH|nr:sterol desaturase family protein [Reyranella aquatilis]MCC8430302.1 sterol desaturase family protein [Reyranella aquatilis]